MPPVVPPNIGNEAANELINDHYAENMLNLSPRVNSRQKNEIVEKAQDEQSLNPRRPGKRQKRSGRNAGKQTAPFKANAPLQDLVSPGMKLNTEDKPNIDEILHKRQEIEDEFKIQERPQKKTTIASNSDSMLKTTASSQ